MFRYDDIQRFHFWSEFRAFLLWEMDREYTEEKKRALSAIMAHYEKSRLFAFTDEQAQRAAVFRLDVAQLTCKEHL